MQSFILQYRNGQWNGLPEKLTGSGNNMLLLYGDRMLLEDNSVRKSLKALLPDTDIITVSGAGEICQDSFNDQTVIAVVCRFNKTTIKHVCGQMDHYPDAFDMGRSLAASLPAAGLKHVLVFAEGNILNGSELTEGILSVLPEGVKLSGGMAGDNNRFEKTLTGLNDDVNPGNAVLTGLYGDAIRISSSVQSGWIPFGPERTITRADKNRVYEIDGKNIIGLYKEYLGPYAKELPASALFFPLGLIENDPDMPVVRTILNLDEKNECMTFAGNLPQGSKVRFMRSGNANLISSVAEAVIDAQKQLHGHQVSLAFAVSCVGRKMMLGERTAEEAETIAELMKAGTTIAGFYSYGEIAPAVSDGRPRLHNQTFTITLFAEE